jgi:hypothetical protein
LRTLVNRECEREVYILEPNRNKNSDIDIDADRMSMRRKRAERGAPA